jgi:hypothetical protein
MLICVLLQPMMHVSINLFHLKKIFLFQNQKVICVTDRTQIVLDDLARRHSEIVDVQQGNIGGLQESMSTML